MDDQCYCRMDLNSDIWVFSQVRQGYLFFRGFITYTCCLCSLSHYSLFSCYHSSDMLQHVYKHRIAGHKVPENTIIKLKKECGRL